MPRLVFYLPSVGGFAPTGLSPLRKVTRRTNWAGVTELSHPSKVTLPTELGHSDGTLVHLTVTPLLNSTTLASRLPRRVLLDDLVAGLTVSSPTAVASPSAGVGFAPPCGLGSCVDASMALGAARLHFVPTVWHVALSAARTCGLRPRTWSRLVVGSSFCSCPACTSCMHAPRTHAPELRSHGGGSPGGLTPWNRGRGRTH